MPYQAFIFLIFVFFSLPSFGNNEKPTSSAMTVKTDEKTDFNEILQAHLNDLKKTKISATYYNSAVKDKVCPYLKDLKSFEEKASKDEIKEEVRKEFLSEIIQVLAHISQHTSHHLIMYCLYNYFEEPWNRELRVLARKTLKAQVDSLKKIKEMMHVCDRETKKGNGDQFQEEKKKKPNLTSFLSKKGLLFLKDLFFSKAYAETLEDTCLVGGLVSFKEGESCSIPDRPCENQEGGFQCGPIFNDKCVKKTRSLSQDCYETSKEEALNPDFKLAYEDPSFEDILKNCENSPSTGCKYFNKRYGDHLKEMASDLETEGEVLETSVASDEIEILSEESEETGNFLDIFDGLFGKGDEKRELAFHNPPNINQRISDIIYENAQCYCQTTQKCSRGCVKNRSDPFAKIKTRCRGSKPVGSSSEYCMRHVTAAIMGVVHEFITNHCQSMGFPIIASREDKGECSKIDVNSTKVNVCTNSLVYPSAICGVDLAGDIPTFKEGEESSKQIPKKCLDKPQAFCKVKDPSLQDYEFLVKKEKIRSRCRTWSDYNRQIISSVPIEKVIKDTGEVSYKMAPLFVRVPLENVKKSLTQEIKVSQKQEEATKERDPQSVNPEETSKETQEAQNKNSDKTEESVKEVIDIEKIPEGAIIIMESESDHGHAEIKTSKKECGTNKNETCFCSDFCEPRSGEDSYEAKDLDIKGIFIFNPEIFAKLKQSS